MMAAAGRCPPPFRQPYAFPTFVEISDDDEPRQNPYLHLPHRGGDRSNPITVENCTDDGLVQQGADVSVALSTNNVIDVESLEDDDVEVVEDRKAKRLECYSGRSFHRPFSGPSIKEPGGSSNNYSFFRTSPKVSPSPRFMYHSRRSLHRPFTGPSIKELGESSSNHSFFLTSSMGAPSSPILATIPCGICMEDKLPSKFFSAKGCTHLFCSDCICQYIQAKLQDNVTAIGCPEPDCGVGTLEPEMCFPILSTEVFDRWCTALCEGLYVGKIRFYCPFKDCSALLINETSSGDGVDDKCMITSAECPHCHRLFCAQCKVPWHIGLSCSLFQQLGEDERGVEDMMLVELAARNQWQRCPECRFFVERTAGCMFMQCRCGFRFCYGCASPMVDHYCSTCRR